MGGGMRRLFVILCLAGVLQGCASAKTTAPALTDLARFNSGGSAILIINTGGQMACETAAFGIHRDGAPQNEVALTVRDHGYATTQPAILVVQPGTYQVDRAGMVPEQMNVLPYWFGKVDVKAGEVVYLGTLDTEILDFKTAMSDNQKFWNTIFLTGRGNIESKYVSFQFKDQSDEILERLRVSHPDLASKLTIRRPPVYITKESFARAMVRAYTPNPDGTLPKTEEVEARLTVELKALAQEAAAQRRLQTNAPTIGVSPDR
jgi:hypothetical protein